MGCAGSKDVLARLEAENESLREDNAQLEAKSDAALLKEKAELEHRVQVLELKLESSHDLHAETTLKLEKALEDLKREQHVTDALKHHLCGQLSEVRSLVWRKGASSGGNSRNLKQSAEQKEEPPTAAVAAAAGASAEAEAEAVAAAAAAAAAAAHTAEERAVPAPGAQSTSATPSLEPAEAPGVVAAAEVVVDEDELEVIPAVVAKSEVARAVVAAAAVEVAAVDPKCLPKQEGVVDV